MKKELFQKITNQAHQRIQKAILGQVIQNQQYLLQPKSSIQLQGIINHNNDVKKIEGFMLEPIRKPHQVLYRQSSLEIKHFNFEIEEKNKAKLQEKFMSLARGGLTNEDFKCFLMLQLLQKDSLSHYFLQPPNSISLKLPDYSQKINRPLGIIKIANKILRGDYKSRQQFRIDMVTMLNNFKVYFKDDQQLFQIAVRFEHRFWKIYEEQLKKYEKIIEQYDQICKQLQKPAFMRQKARRKEYDIEERKAINKQIKSQPEHMRKEIIDYLSQNCKDMIKNGEIKILDIPSKHLRKIAKMMNSQLWKPKPVTKKIKTSQMTIKDQERQLKNNQFSFESQKDSGKRNKYDVYFSDEDYDLQSDD